MELEKLHRANRIVFDLRELEDELHRKENWQQPGDCYYTGINFFSRFIDMKKTVVEPYCARLREKISELKAEIAAL